MVRSLNYGNLVNWNHPLNRGLVCWFINLPSRGKAQNIINYAKPNHGSFTGNTAWSSLKRSGGYGSWSFDGTNDSIQLQRAPIFGTSAYYVSVWYRFANTATLTGRTFYKVGLDEYDFYIEGSFSPVQLHCKSSPGGIGRVFTSNTLNDGNWHHILVTSPGPVNANTTIAYEDGVAMSILSTIDGSPNVVTDTCWFSSDDVFATDGQLDDMRVGNINVSDSFAAKLYLESKRGYPGAMNRLQRHYSNIELQNLKFRNRTTIFKPANMRYFI